MAVQYSTQSVVSDGTLSTIVLGIKYVLRANIYLRIDGVETPQTGAPSGYTWSFLDATTIRVLPVVPAGITVEVYRRTDITGMYNVFSQNAQFDEGTIDENNTQLLYIAQEYLEQDLTGVGIASLEYVRSEPGYEIYRFQRSDGTYFPEFQVPTDTAALETHKVSTDQHTILGVAGLSSALSALTTADTALSTRVDTLELRKSTCLVNATGTGAPHETVSATLPANIAANTRYVLANPFGDNVPVSVFAQLYANGVWADPGWDGNSQTSNESYGARASYVPGVGIVIQTGTAGVVGKSIHTGGGHNTSSVAELAPCRVFVRKLEA